MSNYTTTYAIRFAEVMTASEFESKFGPQITVLDQDNCSDPDDGIFNVVFEGKDGSETSLLFCNGLLVEISESTEA